MAKLLVTYPIIRFHALEVELSDDEADDVLNMCHDDKVKFIEKHHEVQKIDEMIVDSRSLSSALDYEYASIKPDMTTFESAADGIAWAYLNDMP